MKEKLQNTQREEDLNMIYYFWFEKGNLEQWVNWHKVRDKYPEIQEAWINYKTARKSLGDTISNSA